MDAYTFLLWALGIVVIGIPLVLFGIPCVNAATLGRREVA